MQLTHAQTAHRWNIKFFMLLFAATIPATAHCQTTAAQQRQPTSQTQPGTASQQQGRQEMNESTLALPSGDKESSVLLVERIAPRQVMVGQANQYSIRVTNLSDNILGQVVVSESLGQGMQIASSQPVAQSMNQPQNQQQQQQASQNQQTTGSQIVQWQLGMLAPQETKTIQVNAVVSQMGTINNCLTASYYPALCAATEVVKPNLEMTAQLEAEGQLLTVCDTPMIRYSVRNSGSGVAEDVQVIHPLPQGLTSSDGQTTIVLAVGDLSAGETKALTTQLKSAQPGNFETRAYAKSATDDAYSSPIAVQIGQPQLDVQVLGPEQVHLGDTVQYNVTIRNTGNIASRDTKLQLETEGIDPADRTRNIGRLEAGKATAVSVAVRQTGQETVQLSARASSYCAEDVMASATTTIRTVPALRLEVIDQTDPVKVGETTVYAVSVKNQGNAAAKNVTLTATLPPQLQFVEGSGTSAVNAQGNQVQFDPLATLNPGDVAAWYVTAKGATAGDARLQLEMNGDYLDKPVIEQEPTRVQ